MTVAELIERLRPYPPELEVMTLGYEGGYEDLPPDALSLRKVQREVNTEGYYGRHDDPDPADPRPIQKALILGQHPRAKTLQPPN